MMMMAGAALPLFAQEGAEAVEAESPKALKWNGGGDFRVRQEIYDRLPGTGGNISKYNSYFRMRARAWGEVKNEDFTLYARVADEFREYARKPGHRYGETPGELILDNLYLDLKNLFGGHLDLRIGRQDFMQGPNFIYGSGRIIADGTPMDGSRTFFFDAARAVVKFDDKNTLDVVGLYNSDKTFSLGTPHAIGGDYLPLNCIEPWAQGLVEWGGFLYFKSKEVEQLPFDLYYIYAQKSSYALLNGTKMQGRRLNTFGFRVAPKITDDLSAEIEFATQYGYRDDGKIIGGQMGYAGLTYKLPSGDSGVKPYTTLSVLWMSGERHKSSPGMADRSWDPLWARYTFLVSEMYVYRGISGVGYWSNLVFPSLEMGAKWAFSEGGNEHAAFATFGPMLVETDDHLGGGDGSLYGYYLRTRYDFPILMGFISKEKKRGNLFGHLTAEFLEPGNYCTSHKMAYFLRWEISITF